MIPFPEFCDHCYSKPGQFPNNTNLESPPRPITSQPRSQNFDTYSSRIILHERNTQHAHSSVAGIVGLHTLFEDHSYCTSRIANCGTNYNVNVNGTSSIDTDHCYNLPAQFTDTQPASQHVQTQQSTVTSANVYVNGTSSIHTDHSYNLPEQFTATQPASQHVQAQQSTVTSDNVNVNETSSVATDHSYNLPAQFTDKQPESSQPVQTQQSTVTSDNVNVNGTSSVDTDHSYNLSAQFADTQPASAKHVQLQQHTITHDYNPVNSSDSLSRHDVNATNISDLYNLSNYSGQYTILSIRQQRYKSFDIPSDGNCLFTCLSLAIHGTFSHSKLYRNVICQYIGHNWNEWQDLIQIAHDPTITSAKPYLDLMVDGHGWGTVCEIKAACKLLNVNINIWLKGLIFNETLHRYETFCNVEKYVAEIDTNRSVTLLLNNGHFTVLHKLCPRSDSLCATIPLSDSEKLSLTSDASGSLTGRTVPKRKGSPLSTKQVLGIKKRKHIAKDKCQSNMTTQAIKEQEHEVNCRKLGVTYMPPLSNETKHEETQRNLKNARNIKRAQQKYNVNVSDLPQPPPTSSDTHFNDVMDSIREFELQQMSYTFKKCDVCNECRLDMKMAGPTICRRCHLDKVQPNMFSSLNNMHPADVPNELQNLTLVEQQLICRISPAMHIHMLKHGGIAATGHCVTFPQNVNEPAQILPRLPADVHVLRVRKTGRNDTSKDFNVRRAVVQNALSWLKTNNPAYTDIIISDDRLSRLPENGELTVETVETTPTGKQAMDHGPAPQQIDPGDVDTDTVSYVALPETSIDIRDEVQQVVDDVLGTSHVPVAKKNKKITIPWPTRDNVPLSEFTTQHFFTLAFPCLFPDGTGDFHINRPRTCSSMSDWAEHLMWHKDGRFAQHQYFKFVVHNIIARKRTLEQSSYIVKQQLGDEHLTISDLKRRIEQGDDSIAKKILYFGACLRGTSQYWSQRSRDLRGLIQFQINEEKGLPSFFTTGSCAEYYFKSLTRLLQLYTLKTSGVSIDLQNKNALFSVLQKNTHVVSHYFDLRTKSYFDTVMRTAFDVDTYWYRQEFAKSRGMIHWHGLCWRRDREPHDLLHEAIDVGLSSDETANKLAKWAEDRFGMTASHPAGSDAEGKPRKELWPQPEGTAPPPSEEDNPLLKLLLDVSETQESMLEDHLLLTNKINIHRCSSYCLRQLKPNCDKVCRLEFGTESKPGKIVRSSHAIVKDKNGSMRLEMARDHSMMVQHSRYHTQGWRANGDISLILSRSGATNPSVDDIIATEKYITGYACKGNQPTESLVQLFNEITHSVDDASDATAKTLCTKLLMNTVKRDISSVEASYELLSLPLFRCSHTFQTISFSGSRVLEKTGETLTKSTPLDKYLHRPQNDESSWYQFICQKGNVPVNNGTCNRALWPLNDEYARTVLLLHWPNWRKISDIKHSDTTWVTALENFLDNTHCPNFVKADIERAKRHQSPDHIVCQDSQEETDDHPDDQPDWMTLMHPQEPFEELVATDFTYDDGGPCYNWEIPTENYPTGLGLRWIEELPSNDHYEQLAVPDASVCTLNHDQKFAFNLVMNALLCHRESPQSTKPLRLIVSGTAGSGKSYLIKCLVHTIRKLFKNYKAVQVLCPTGNSANLISGRTIHSFLKIPTSFKAAKELTPPDGERGISIQANCQDLVALLVDERSMVGCRTLGWMEFLCRHGMKSMSSSWGGLPVVVFLGDDVQLPPVLDSPLYMSTGKCPAALHGTLVWKEFDKAVVLHTIVRQNEEQQHFKSVLTSLRDYTTSSADVQWLQQFQWEALRSSHGTDLLADMDRHGLFVFPTHAAEWEHNKTHLLVANEMAPVAKIVAVNTGVHANAAPSDKSGGLLPILHICRGAKVMLTTNIHVEFGLFNGAMGEVVDILFLDGRRPTNSLPDVVMVSFSKYTGPPFLQHRHNVIPLVPIERRIECPCHNCKRKQLPLRLGWGTTIHRCQGMTIGQGEPNRYIVIDPGSRKFESTTPGALFVALSRAKSAGGPNESPDFAWNPQVLVNEDRLCHAVNTPTTRARSQEIKRIATTAVSTRQQHSDFDTEAGFNTICATVEKAQNHAEE